jgi:anti-anti-sigma factor
MFAAFLHAFCRDGSRDELDELEIRQWHTAHAIIVRVFGELWLTNISQFREAMDELLGQPKRVIVVDLTGVTFIGSEGIRALFQIAKELKSRGGEMRIVAPPSPVRDTFEATLMHRVLKVHESVADALHAACGLAGAP